MGTFLHCAVFLDCGEPAARAAIAEAAKDDDMNLRPDECFCQSLPKGTSALLSDFCCGYEPLAKCLSELVKKPVMLLYIYDDDFWGYYFYENGRELDSFSTLPDALEDIPETEWERLKGRPEVVASYFRVDAGRLERYLRFWTEEAGEDEPAYPEDSHAPWDCWQMTDFMNALGFPYSWG